MWGHKGELRLPAPRARTGLYPRLAVRYVFQGLHGVEDSGASLFRKVDVVTTSAPFGARPVDLVRPHFGCV